MRQYAQTENKAGIVRVNLLQLSTTFNLTYLMLECFCEALLILKYIFKKIKWLLEINYD